jgi:hypothetical protein
MRLLCARVVAAALSVAAGTPGRSQQPAAAPTFYRDVLPILQQHCQSCHRAGEIGPMPLTTYAATKPFAAAIAAAAQSRKMPPWFADAGVGHFANDPSLSTDEIRSLAHWASAGAPEGDRKDAPAARTFAKGWNIAQPDAVVRMPKPVAIPSSGDVEYTYEIVPTGFTQDRWVQMSEVRPASRANVHHAVIYVRPPGSTWLHDAPRNVPFTADDMPSGPGQPASHTTTEEVLLVYAPGSSPDQWPTGMAKFIPKGSDLVFQMHYTTNGHATTDQTAFGMVFAKAAPAKRVLTLQLTNGDFVIPPGVDDYRVEAHGSVPNDALLLSFFPHMHLRGKRFEYNILKPGGAEALLRVNYDFYWQLSYKLAQPMPLKAGTELQAVAWYDNSKKNPHNPDPNAAVYWGDQTDDEMMVGFFDVAVPANIDKPDYFMRDSARH